jgi:hypothetical protein
MLGNDSAVLYRIYPLFQEAIMKKVITTVVAFFALASLVLPGQGQITSPGGGIPVGGNNMGRGTMTQEQFNKVVEYADQAKRLTKEDKEKGKTLADLLAEDKAAAIELVKSMPLTCDVSEAMLVAQGPDVVEGKKVETKTYEVSCSNGQGYFLVSADQIKPYGFSCFAADATRTADVSAGRKPGAVCQLPANADMKAMAGAILGKAGIQCAIKDYRYVGQNAANHTEFDEFACLNGQGYMVITALPGAQIPVHVETCNASASRGLACKLSDNGMLPVTLQMLRDALAKNNVSCDATDQSMHVIGQENAKKRYVVEFMCSQQPKGLVAYIPLAGATAQFEALTCAEAGKRGAKCSLNKVN